MGILQLKSKVPSLAERFGERDQKKANANIKKAKGETEKQLADKQKKNEKAKKA